MGPGYARPVPRPERPTRHTPNRRTILAGLTGAAALTGCRATTTTHTSPPATTDGALTSAYWPGVKASWRIARPSATPKALVVALHGFGMDGPTMMDGLGLADHVERTGLAIAAVSGGNTYWHKRRAGMDTGALVIHDFIPLAQRTTGVDPKTKVALLGLSMGGYGSLLLGSDLGPDRVFGVVAESAALWIDPGKSAQAAFDDREDFLAHDVFARTDVLSRMPVRLDCGTSDPFIAANRAFAAKLPTAKATFDKGAHTLDYWRSHASAQLDWLAALT